MASELYGGGRFDGVAIGVGHGVHCVFFNYTIIISQLVYRRS